MGFQVSSVPFKTQGRFGESNFLCASIHITATETRAFILNYHDLPYSTPCEGLYTGVSPHSECAIPLLLCALGILFREGGGDCLRTW